MATLCFFLNPKTSKIKTYNVKQNIINYSDSIVVSLLLSEGNITDKVVYTFPVNEEKQSLTSQQRGSIELLDKIKVNLNSGVKTIHIYKLDNENSIDEVQLIFFIPEFGVFRIENINFNTRLCLMKSTVLSNKEIFALHEYTKGLKG